MQGILGFDAGCQQFAGDGKQAAGFRGAKFFHWAIVCFLAWKGFCAFSNSKDVRPRQLQPSLLDFGLDIQLRFGFQPNPKMALIVERPVEYAIIQVYSHGGLRVAL